MEAQKFEERVRQITVLVSAFLSSFKTPDHLTDEDLQAKVIREISESINGNIKADAAPNEISHRIERMAARLRDTYRSQAWPRPAHFVKALEETAPPPEPAPVRILDQSLSLREKHFHNGYIAQSDEERYFLTRDEVQQALKEPIGRAEWEHHVNVQVCRKGGTFAERQADELAWYRSARPHQAPGWL